MSMKLLRCSRHVKLHVPLAFGTSLGYLFLLPLFYQRVGPIVTALAVFPVAVVGWFFGLQVGTLVGLINIGLTGWITILMKEDLLIASVGTVAVAAVGALIGWAGDLSRGLRRKSRQLAQRHTELEEQIAERKRIEATLRETKERYALAIRAANDGLWDWDLERNTMYYSPRWKAQLGYTDDEIDGCPDEWFRRVHPDDIDRLKQDINAHLDGLMPQFRNEHRMLHQDGTYRWMLSRGLAVRRDDGPVYRMVGSQTDVTGRKFAEEQLIHDAFHDALTDLPNRALFMDRLSQAIERSRRSDQVFAVLFLDCDQFKRINDSLGHMVGDRLLVTVARRLETRLRPTDTVARLGGDEFAVLLENVESVDIVDSIADRIQRDLQEPFELEEHELVISASIGIVLIEGQYQEPAAVLRDADIAMYRAKDRGKAQHILFDASMRGRMLARLSLENDLRRALERQQLYLQYQPIVSLADFRIIGFEALLRWHHPNHGHVSPAEFIPIAEATGLIVPIGEWILRHACSQIRTWQAQYAVDQTLTMSVNLSGKQFALSNMVDVVERVLRDISVPTSALSLEITESVIMKNVDEAERQLQRLRDIGVQVQMDDFGTGYSSLGYLHQFPIDTIKIDRSFVGKMDVDESSRDIVQAIVTLAHNLGLDVVAEGVETERQLEQLKRLGCQHAQGYFFSPPLDEDDAGSLLQVSTEGIFHLSFS